MKTAIALIVITGLFPNAYGTLTVNPLWEKSGAKLALNQVTIEECADRLVAHYKQNSLLFSNLTNEIFKYNLPPDSMKKRRDIGIPVCSFGEALSRVALAFGVAMRVNDFSVVFGEFAKSDLFLDVEPETTSTLTWVPVDNMVDGLAGELKLGRVQISLINYNVRWSVLRVSCNFEEYRILRSATQLIGCGVLFKDESVTFVRKKGDSQNGREQPKQTDIAD